MVSGGILRNLRQAARLLRRRPAFTATCLATLILGIALNTIAFGIVNALWFRPLPFPDGNRMVVLYERNVRSGARAGASYSTFRDWRDQAQSSVSMAAVFERSCNIAPNGSERGIAVSVGAAFISLGAVEFMGFRPLKGRSFVPGDQNAAARPVMIGERFWQDRFAADPEIVGRKLLVDGEEAVIVGVLPRRFQVLYGGYQLIALLDEKGASLDRTERVLHVVARLKPGISLDQAQAEMEVISARIAPEHPVSNRDWGPGYRTTGNIFLRRPSGCTRCF